MQQNVPNTLTTTNLVGQGGFTWDQPSEDPQEDIPYEKSEYEEDTKHLNIVRENHPLNILLGGSYIHPQHRQSQINTNKIALVLAMEDSGRFKGCWLDGA